MAILYHQYIVDAAYDDARGDRVPARPPRGFIKIEYTQKEVRSGPMRLCYCLLLLKVTFLIFIFSQSKVFYSMQGGEA